MKENLLNLQKLCSIHNPQSFKHIIRIHSVFLQYHLNYALINKTDKKFLSYLDQSLTTLKKVVSDVRNALEKGHLNAVEKAVCLKSADAILDFFRLSTMTLSILPSLFKNIDASARELGWPKDSAFRFLKNLVASDYEQGTAVKDSSKFANFLKLTSIAEKFRGFQGVDQSIQVKANAIESITTAYIAFSLMHTPKDFENVLEESTAELAGKMLLPFVDAFFEIRNEIAKLHNTLDGDKMCHPEKIGVAKWVEAFLEGMLVGDAKNRFTEQFAKIRKERNVLAIKVTDKQFKKGVEDYYEAKKLQKSKTGKGRVEKKTRKLKYDRKILTRRRGGAKRARRARGGYRMGKIASGRMGRIYFEGFWRVSFEGIFNAEKGENSEDSERKVNYRGLILKQTRKNSILFGPNEFERNFSGLLQN